MIFPDTFFTIVDRIAPICDDIFGARTKREWAILFFFYIIKVEALYGAGQSPPDRSDYRPYDFTSWTKLLTDGRPTPWYKSVYMNLNNIVVAEGRSRVVLAKLGTAYAVYTIKHKNRNQRLRKQTEQAAQIAKDPIVRAFFSELPTVYVEDQAFYAQFVYRSSRPINPYRFRNGMGIMYANRISENLPIRLQQHGGYYGEVADHGNYQVESALADNFYTWGWKYGAKDVPYGSEKLAEIERAYRENAAPAGIQGKTVFMPAMVDRYKPAIAEFLDLLRSDRGCDLAIRAYRYKPIYSKGMYAWFDREIQGIRLNILPPQSNITALKKSSLIILLNHPSTTFLECIFLDHPVVAYLDGSLAMDERYAAIATPLTEVSVLHPNLDSMISFIDELSDIGSWWREVTSSTPYRVFKATYCRRIEDSVA